jgi:hypothetical protein
MKRNKSIMPMNSVKKVIAVMIMMKIMSKTR